MKTLKHEMNKPLARGCMAMNLNADRPAPESVYLFRAVLFESHRGAQTGIELKWEPWREIGTPEKLTPYELSREGKNVNFENSHKNSR